MNSPKSILRKIAKFIFILLVLAFIAICVLPDTVIDSITGNFSDKTSSVNEDKKRLKPSSPKQHNKKAYERIKDEEKHNDPATHNFDYDDDYEKFMEETPQSSCFSEVGYDDEACILYARFRDSGSLYSYHDFEPEVFYEFINDESLGRYFNYYIKGYYYCERLE